MESTLTRYISRFLRLKHFIKNEAPAVITDKEKKMLESTGRELLSHLNEKLYLFIEDYKNQRLQGNETISPCYVCENKINPQPGVHEACKKGHDINDEATWERGETGCIDFEKSALKWQVMNDMIDSEENQLNELNAMEVLIFFINSLHPSNSGFNVKID